MEQATDASGETSFRRSPVRWGLVACFGVFCLVGLSGIPASSYQGGHYSTGSAFVIGFRVFYAVMAVGSLVLMVRAARMGLFADEDGLTIRNVFGTHRAAWREIAGFESPAPYRRTPRHTGLKVVLLGRPPVYASLYTAALFNKSGFADETLAQLEALRIEHGAPSDVTELNA